MLQRAAVHRVVPAIGSPLVGHLLVGKHRPQRRAPVHRHLGHVGQAILIEEPALLIGLQLGELELPGLDPKEVDVRYAPGRDGRDDVPAKVHDELTREELVLERLDGPGGVGLVVIPTVVQLQEDPLRPAVVVRIGRGQPARPVVGEAQQLDLPLDVGDVLRRRFARMDTMLHRVLLGRQPEGVVAHRVQDVVAQHPREPRDDVRGRVALRMPHVQTGAAGIGEHVQHVEPRPVGGKTLLARVGLAEGLMLLPILLPLALEGCEVIPGHGLSSSDDRPPYSANRLFRRLQKKPAILVTFRIAGRRFLRARNPSAQQAYSAEAAASAAKAGQPPSSSGNRLMR